MEKRFVSKDERSAITEVITENVIKYFEEHPEAGVEVARDDDVYFDPEEIAESDEPGKYIVVALTSANSTRDVGKVEMNKLMAKTLIEESKQIFAEFCEVYLLTSELAGKLKELSCGEKIWEEIEEYSRNGEFAIGIVKERG